MEAKLLEFLWPGDKTFSQLQNHLRIDNAQLNRLLRVMCEEQHIESHKNGYWGIKIAPEVRDLMPRVMACMVKGLFIPFDNLHKALGVKPAVLTETLTVLRKQNKIVAHFGGWTEK
jgi:DNA-binding HxlR family transcriptional regulator